MLHSDLILLSKHPSPLVESAVMAVYWGNKLVGFTQDREFSVGEIFENPFDDNTRLAITSVNYEKDRILVKIMS